MLKLNSSNGTLLSHLFSHRLHFHGRNLVHLFSTSTSTSTRKAAPNSSLVNFMVKSLGFSNQEAIATSLKVYSLNSTQNPNSVVNFFKQNGFSDTHIKKIVSLKPNVLRCDIEDTLKPNIRVFQDLGLSGSDLGQFLASNNSAILIRKNCTHILTVIDFLTSILGTKENVVKVLRKCRGWYSVDVATRNHAVLRNYGVTSEWIKKILVQYPNILRINPNKFEETCARVEHKFGIPVKSHAFLPMIAMLTHLSTDNVHLKYEVFKSYGWSESDIHTLISQLPVCLGLSEVRIRSKLEFFMKKIGFEPGYIASNSSLLAYSLEKRVVPRYAVLQILKERKLVSVGTSLYGALTNTESRFVNRFVIPYKEELPGLYEAYSNNNMDSYGESCLLG